MTINEFWNIIELGQDIKNSCEETDKRIALHLKSLSNEKLVKYKRDYR